ncbi:hypothetical protein MMC22_009089 [Lobaria immixta]|nr:hypothetical protein [Lobaria immixta]
MASNNDSEILDAPSNLTTPFSIAAKSNISSVPARHIRNTATRRPILVPQLPMTRSPDVSTFEASSNQSSFSTMPTGIEERTKDAEFINDEEESLENSAAGNSLVNSPSQIPGPETGLSQSSATPRQRDHILKPLESISAARNRLLLVLHIFRHQNDQDDSELVHC